MLGRRYLFFARAISFTMASVHPPLGLKKTLAVQLSPVKGISFDCEFEQTQAKNKANKRTKVVMAFLWSSIINMSLSYLKILTTGNYRRTQNQYRSGCCFWAKLFRLEVLVISR